MNQTPPPDPLARSLRASLESWEAEVAAYWDRLTRSPDFLQRVGDQLSRTFESQQRINAYLQDAMFQAAVTQQQGARELYLLDRLARQLDTLARRIDDLDARLDDRPPGARGRRGGQR